MTIPQQKSPLELLDQQTRLLDNLLEVQKSLPTINQGNNEFYSKWLNAMLEEQRKQTNYLKNISTVATIWGMITILGIAIGICVGMSTMTR
jgi:hypothetical protein